LAAFLFQLNSNIISKKTTFQELYYSHAWVRLLLPMVLGIIYARYLGAWNLENVYVLVVLALANMVAWLKPKLASVQVIALVQVLFLFFFGKVNAHYFLEKKTTDQLYYTTESAFRKIRIANLVETRPKVWKALATIEGTNTTCLVYFQKKQFIKPTYGDLFAVNTTFENIDPPYNPGQFDYAEYLHLQGVHLRVYLTAQNAQKIGHEPQNPIVNLAYSLNEKAALILERYGNKGQALAVLNAMILGVRSDLDPDLVQAYSAAGAIHVLSVSGLHVGVIMVVLSFLFAPLKRVPRVGKGLFLGLLLGVMWLYALVTGFSAPVLRSTLMFSVIVVANLWAKRHIALNTLAFSAFLLLVWQPTMLFQVGFQLSYLAIIGMVVVQPLLNPLLKIDKTRSFWHRALDRLWKVSTVAIAAQVATLPITIYYFHQFPNYFLLVNPVVILLSSVVLIVGLGFILLAMVLPKVGINLIFAKVLNFFTELLNTSVLKTEALPGSISDFLQLSMPEVLLLYIMLVLFFVYFYFPNKSFLYGVLCLSVPLLYFKVKHTIQAAQREQLVVYSIPKSVAFSYQKGTTLQFYAPDSLLSDRALLNFNCKNHWAAMGVEQVINRSLKSENDLLQVGSQKILCLNQPTKAFKEKIPAQYALLCSKKITYSNVAQIVAPSTQLVLAGNFSPFYIERFKEAAGPDSLRIVILKHTGALVFDLK
jgi:competence protein ComEC